jgi:integrase
MKKYAGSKTVFNFSSRYNDYEGFNKNLNIGLKTVGKAVGINDLEFYQARHTFATLSRNLMKFSKGDVDEALNHVGSFEVADIYIAKDFSIINDNNFKLIKRVFKKELA